MAQDAPGRRSRLLPMARRSNIACWTVMMWFRGPSCLSNASAGSGHLRPDRCSRRAADRLRRSSAGAKKWPLPRMKEASRFSSQCPVGLPSRRVPNGFSTSEPQQLTLLTLQTLPDRMECRRDGHAGILKVGLPVGVWQICPATPSGPWAACPSRGHIFRMCADAPRSVYRVTARSPAASANPPDR